MENNHHRGFIGFQCGYFAFLVPLCKARIDPAKMIATKSQCTEGLVSLKVPQAAAGCDIGCVPVTQVGFADEPGSAMTEREYWFAALNTDGGLTLSVAPM